MMSILLIASLLCLVSVFSDENCYDYRSCYQQNMTDGKITCTGNQGCRGATIETESDVYCYGYYGCYQAEEITGDDIYCNGKNGCRSAVKIVADDLLDCDGQYACYELEQTAIVDGNLYCDGDYSCSYSEFDVDQNAYCDGNLGCRSATIEADSDVFCRGLYSCYEASVEADDSIYIYGAYSGYKATITTGEYIYGYGFKALSYATINKATKIYAYGFYSLYYADIDSKGVDTQYVYAYGRYAARYADYVCQEGSECYLYCQDNGCYDMYYTCLSDSTCNISPSGCLSDNSVSVTDDGVYCPTFQTSDDAETDAQLIQARNDRLQSRLNGDDYIKEMEQADKTEKKFQNKLDFEDNQIETKSNNLLFTQGLFMNSTSASNGVYTLGVAVLSMVITWIFAYYYFVAKNKDSSYKPILENN